jgi:hypothetical protein
VTLTIFSQCNINAIINSAIQNLFCRRFQAKDLQNNILAVEHHRGLVYSYLVTHNALKGTPGISTEALKSTLDPLVSTFVTQTQEVSTNSDR